MNILFIGMGNMGGAIIKAMFQSEKLMKKLKIYGAKNSQKTFDKISEYGELNVFSKEKTIDMDIIFIGVKPYQIGEAVIQHIDKNTIKKDGIIVSMAAGVTLEKLQQIFGEDKKIIRIMPNLPILVNEGMTSITGNKNVEEEDLEKVESLLSVSSKCARISEEKIHGFIGMAGSSPAFAFMFLEAMSEAGVKYGLTREESYFFASQALLGASKMVMEEKKNPGALKDGVCSPGGTTIEGVIALEEYGFRNAVIKGIGATIEKSKIMSK